MTKPAYTKKELNALIPRQVQRDPRFRRLSEAAVVLLMTMAADQRSGTANGHLPVPTDRLLLCGWTQYQIDEARDELLASGLLIQTRMGD
ncbi:hypothetical protein [Cupriavidus oxalaticus]|nr:hypothetical protein [Cupriavidus oxalaticus]